ncbi:MAG TPA: hypothetical protein DEH22_10005, partial [Chloroflexi bacterium]|nr:hypothetical protein [Chloroflexota bacterium]
ISEPRSAPLHITPILAMLAAIALETLIFPMLNRSEHEHHPNAMFDSDDWAERLLASRATKIIFALFFFNWVYSAFMATYHLQENLIVQSDELKGFEWVKANTPSDSSFLLITDEQPMTDPVSEWFPAITQRNSIATLQGQEWTDGKNFEALMAAVLDVQSCAQQTIDCLQAWQAQTGVTFDYVFIRKPTTNEFQEFPGSLPLEYSLADAYRQIYQTDTISIWQRNSP